MDRQYSESFSIPTGGWTGGAQAIMATNSTTLTAGITADVRLWRDSSLTRIVLAPGEILPLKVRHVSHNSTIIGFN
jgi:hypothetical protein